MCDESEKLVQNLFVQQILIASLWTEVEFESCDSFCADSRCKASRATEDLYEKWAGEIYLVEAGGPRPFRIVTL